MAISKYSIPFCLISEIIQRRYLTFNDPERSYYRGWIISILNKKRHGIFDLLYICQQHQSRSGKIKANKTGNFGNNTGFFRKNWTTTYLITTPSKSCFILLLLIFVFEIINPWKNQRIPIFLTWNWQFIPGWREIYIDNVTIIDVAGVQ